MVEFTTVAMCGVRYVERNVAPAKIPYSQSPFLVWQAKVHGCDQKDLQVFYISKIHILLDVSIVI